MKKILLWLVAAGLLAGLCGCGGTAESGSASKAPASVSENGTEAEGQSAADQTEESNAEPAPSEESAVEESQAETSEENTDSGEQTESSDSAPAAEEEATPDALELGTVPNTAAEDEDALVSEYPGKFEQLTYEDAESGLSITYNLYLPESYDESSAYPMVVFIGDSSCAGNDATRSLTQGRGGLIWATAEWQAVYPTIVAVPSYPQTILDDHGSYTTTEYVELTKRYIDYMKESYAVDGVFGTGQSMGCMTTLILAAEYPDLYTACMFVDGQWDITTLTGLEDQTFIYFAAEDDENAWNGAQEVMSMFDADGVEYTYAQWDGTWGVDELSDAADALFAAGGDKYFVSWLTGTVEPDSSMPGGAAYHMASFDYAYNCVAVMEWLIQQD